MAVSAVEMPYMSPGAGPVPLRGGWDVRCDPHVQATAWRTVRESCCLLLCDDGLMMRWTLDHGNPLPPGWSYLSRYEEDLAWDLATWLPRKRENGT